MKDFDVVFTSTTTCSSCKLAKPQLEAAIRAVDPDINLKYINLDELTKYAEQHNITSVPTVLFFKDDCLMGRETGIKSKADYINILTKIYKE